MSATDTLRATLSRLVRRELAKLGIVTFHEYRVVLQPEGQPYVELQAVRPLVGMPDVARCVARPGAAGYTMMYKLGSTVLVGFVEGDPARPFIAFGPEAEAATSGISLPTSVTIEAAGQDSFIQVGKRADEVNLGAAAGSVVRDGDTVRIVVPGTPPFAMEGLLSVTSGTAETPPAVSKVKA